MKKQCFKVFLGAILLPALIVSSCKKDADLTEISDGDATTIPRSVHSNLDLYWGNWSSGTYTTARAVSDFGNISGYDSAEEGRTYVIYENLRVKLLKNLQDAGSGVVAKIDIADHSAYEVHFDVRVGDTFDWSEHGGKMGFGLLIGNGYTGGEDTSDGRGGSLRLVWGVSSAGAYFQPYAYYVDQPRVWGNSFQVKYPATGSLQKNTWYDVKLFAQSNTYSNYNGKIKMTVNGTVVYNDDTFRWTTDHNYRLIKNMSFSTFRGGGVGSEVSTDGYVYFDNMHLNNVTAQY